MKNIMYNSLLFIAIFTIKIINCYNNSLENISKNINSSENISEISSLSSLYKKGFSTLILSSQKSKSAMINFKIKNAFLSFSFGLSVDKLALNNNKYNNIVIDNNKQVILKATSFTINSFDVKGPVKFNNIDQWKLIMHDNFFKNETSLDWNHDKVTKCNNYFMMGGPCQTSSKELIKEVINIPQHSQLRVEANFHFIGTWDSDTGYLKLDNLNNKNDDPKFVWTHRCKNTKLAPVVKICPYETCKMASLINITVDHSDTKIKLIFGTTLERSSCEQSYGISDVKIYMR